VIELEHQRRGIETQVDRLANAQQFVRIFALHQPQEAAQALIVAVDISFHGCPLLSPQAASSYTGAWLGKKIANANEAPWAKNRLARIGQLRLNAADSLRGQCP